MALPAPVARLVRATAGRRALQLALLFGGLFALGIVCGGRAQADGVSDAGSLGSGHVAVREHVADSVGKLRDAGSREAPAPSEASKVAESAKATESAKDTGASTHAKPTAPTQGREAAPATDPAPAPAPAPVRPAESTPNPVDAQHAPGTDAPNVEAPGAKHASGVQHVSDVKRLARPLHDKPAAPGDPATRTTTPTRTLTRTPTAPVQAYLTEPLRQHIEALGGDRARLRSAVDALRYLTAPVGATVRQVTGPVEELATRAVAELVGAVPEQLTHGRLGGIIRIVDPADARPAPPVATAPQQSDAPAVHGDRPATAESRSHAAVSGPQAPDVAQFGDVQKADAGTQAAARPAAPVVPQRPDGAPSAGASAGDGGSTRHGDLHAATFGGRAPVLLASGATASAGTAPVVDRLRDIPEFPG
ncbi:MULTISPECIES: hypothetical protein [unclassified Streptomyces]|uniref:hypothetical protein n=1 Tax=unclassified Streptomyces TaxID=2593676 RepID=UPI002255755F|nr:MULTISPECIES: hypothetical protein [unclassified Streptomyces]MCX4828876.1 hypothetical protein [Streptomyces sp. NBC_01016]